MSAKHCKVYTGTLPVEIFLLHGYGISIDRVESVALKFRALGYDVLCCEYTSHGSRKDENEGNLVFSTMKELESIISERGKKVVLVGHSFGGAIALSVGSEMGKVSQCFAVSAPNGAMLYDEKQRKKTIRYISFSPYHRYVKSDEQDVLSGMPMTHGKCEPVNESKFFLIHSRNDSVVPFSEFERNKELLCIPERNTLVYESITGSGSRDHVMAFYKDETFDFIRNHAITR